MADVVMFILQVVDEVRDVAEGLKENDRQACRLSERVLAVEHPVRNIHEGKKLSSAESLRQLSETLTESRNFLVEYARTSKFTRVLRRKENVDKFTQLGGSLTEGVQALQLDVTVEGWAKEDAADRQEDLKNVMEMMERMERERTDNHAEIMSVLKSEHKQSKVNIPGAIPRIQDWYAPREAQRKRAFELLRINTAGTTAQQARAVGLVGPGGAGKSTLASMVIREADVQAHFRKGVVWLQVGRGADNRLPELMLCLASMVWKRVSEGCARPPEKGGAEFPPEDGAKYIRRELLVDEDSRRSFLVMADDVWEKKVLAELTKAGVWVLYTSRDDSLSKHVVRLNTVDREEAEIVLRRAAELGEGQRLPDAADVIIGRSEVMDLAFVGRWSIVRGRTDAKAWQQVLDSIVASQAGGVSWRTAVLHAGYEELGTGNVHIQKLYLYLAVLPRGLAFAKEVAAVLLHGNDYSVHDLKSASNVIAELERFSMLTLEGGGKLRVHDEHADFIREKIEYYPQDRKRALGAWREYAACRHAVFSWTAGELVQIWQNIDALQGTGVTPRPLAGVLDAVDRSDELFVLDRLLSFYDLRRLPGKALENAKEMLADEERELGPQDPRIVPSLECAGINARLVGSEDEANAFFQRARAIQGETHRRSDEEAQEVETIEDHTPCLQRNLAMRLKSLRPGHRNIPITYCQLGVGARRAGNVNKAEEFLQKALEICETQDRDGIETTRPLHWIGVLHLETERIDSAETYLQRALEIRRRQLGPDHPHVADTVHALGRCDREAGREQKAVARFLRVLKIREEFEEPATAQKKA